MSDEWYSNSVKWSLPPQKEEKLKEPPIIVSELIDEILMNSKVGREFVEHSPHIKKIYSSP
jgi:hypothetical protein